MTEITGIITPKYPLIDKELKEMTLGVTEQYLEIHSPVYVNGKVKVERIDREDDDGIVIAYVPVLGEVFFLTVFIDININEIINISTESHNRVYFHASSEILSQDQLAGMCKLAITGGRIKGDSKGNTGKVKYKYSSVIYLPNPEPDNFEGKLIKLLDFLEQDNEGVKRLIKEADGYIQVSMDVHNANGMVGGPYIDRNIIKRMADLGLGIDFDLYVSGSPFKDHN